MFLQSFGGDDIEGSRGVADKARAFADQLPAHTVSVAQVLKHCAVYRCAATLLVAKPGCSHTPSGVVRHRHAALTS